MERAKQTKGLCAFCHVSYAKSAMKRHLTNCRERARSDKADDAATQGERIFHLVVTAYRDYWLHLEMPACATLADLDGFLRRIWLDCCGHMSMFEVSGRRFSAESDGFDDEGTDLPLAQVLTQGLRFDYRYDFGTSTDLKLEVVGERMGVPLDDEVYIMARNEAPEIPCEVCGEPAVIICTECQCSGEGMLCKKDARKHKCDESLLPLLNSPRAGVCGYDGK